MERCIPAPDLSDWARSCRLSKPERRAAYAGSALQNGRAGNHPIPDIPGDAAGKSGRSASGPGTCRSANAPVADILTGELAKWMVRPTRRLFPWLLLGALLAYAAGAYLQYRSIAYDKGVNANVLQSLRDKRNLPVGIVVPPNNRWKSNAFIAERDGTTYSILILDDHYRGSDRSFRSDSGVIGDEIGQGFLCAIPAQATAKGVAIDPAVTRMIKSRCGNSR